MYKDVKNQEKNENNLNFGQGEVKENVYPHRVYPRSHEKGCYSLENVYFMYEKKKRLQNGK